MKLKEYLKALKKLAKENPQTLEFDVIYSSDDEGNDFQKTVYTPTIGKYSEEERTYETNDLSEANSVCLN